MEHRPCGDCSACCEGWLKGNAYGNEFKPYTKCPFLIHGLCSIYSTKPEFCSKYQCAWSQGLLDEDMQPNTCGLLVSVKTKEDGSKFLEAVPIRKDVSYDTYRKLDDAARRLDVKWMLVEVL